jgi:hypothetical protein
MLTVATAQLDYRFYFWAENLIKLFEPGGLSLVAVSRRTDAYIDFVHGYFLFAVWCISLGG